MVLSLWDIASALIGSATIAATAFPMPIPQPVDYRAQTAGQIASTPFSTDPTRGRVAAEVSSGPQVEVFIYNNLQCSYPGQQLFYQLYVGNMGDAAARTVVAQFQPPANATFTSAAPPPTRQDAAGRPVWDLGTLAPRGGYVQISANVTVNPVGSASQESRLTAAYVLESGFNSVAFTAHVIPDNCSAADSPTEKRPTEKRAAIICDPAEISCVEFLPGLGVRFGGAQPATEPLTLGKRFREAVADIIPGECRVAGKPASDGSKLANDDIIADPAYQDALNRMYDPAAFYLEPLYQSGQDFKRLNHENYMLGITFSKQAHETLQAIHTNYWNNQTVVLKRVLQGTTSTNAVRNQINGWRDGWIRETQQVQQQLAIRYGQMQQQRKAKFDPVAQKAVTNAQVSIGRSCNTSTDGGLSGLLPPVKTAYEASLDQRLRTFSETQSLFVSPDSVVFPQPIRAGTWMSELRSALDAFDAGNIKPLQTYVADIPRKDTEGFGTAFRLTYGKHQSDDRVSDEQIRLTRWEVALDTPKTVSTDCQKDKVFQRPVETTYCESNLAYPETLGPAASQQRATSPGARPFEPIGPGSSVINDDLVKGQACSGQSGDPWWSNGCECKCNDQIPVTDANGNITFQNCQNVYEITLHDPAVQDQQECLLQKAHHGPFF